ncbi:MAG: hypothetical protein IKE38_04110 [Erysipelotrichaceae bacterium]|nr:hypothetical protein [Erysipelotrichaceae bacterium]
MKKGVAVTLVMIATLAVALLVGALLLFAMRYFYQTMGQKGVIIVLAGGAGLLLVFLYLIEVFRRIKNGDKGKFD